MEKIGDQLQHRQMTVVKAVNLEYEGNILKSHPSMFASALESGRLIWGFEAPVMAMAMWKPEIM